MEVDIQSLLFEEEKKLQKFQIGAVSLLLVMLFISLVIYTRYYMKKRAQS
jgi:hypothetical protein